MRRFLVPGVMAVVAYLVATCIPPPPARPTLRCRFNDGSVYAYPNQARCPAGSAEVEVIAQAASRPAPSRPTGERLQFCRDDAGTARVIPVSESCAAHGWDLPDGSVELARPPSPAITSPPILYAPIEQQYDEFRRETKLRTEARVSPEFSVRVVASSSDDTTLIGFFSRNDRHNYLRCRSVDALLNGQPVSFPELHYDSNVGSGGVTEYFMTTLGSTAFNQIVTAQSFRMRICSDVIDFSPPILQWLAEFQRQSIALRTADGGVTDVVSVDVSDLPETPEREVVLRAIAEVADAVRVCVGRRTSPLPVVFILRGDGHVDSVTMADDRLNARKRDCAERVLQTISVLPFRRPTFSVSAAIQPH